MMQTMVTEFDTAIQKSTKYNIPVSHVPNILLGPPPFKPETLKDMEKLLDAGVWRDTNKLLPCLPHIRELQLMIGQDDAKHMVLDNIYDMCSGTYQKQNFVVTGPPGVGKTTFIEHLSKIILTCSGKKGKVIHAKRNDLIAEYLGQTAKKTYDVLKSAENGILVIDEASSLAPSSAGSLDSFTKSMIDTLNRGLTELDVVCILAGYQNEVYKTLFAVNPGMQRRFGCHISLKPYTGNQLKDIIIKSLEQKQLKVDGDIIQGAQLSQNMFPYHAGSAHNFVTDVIKHHKRRTFGKLDKKTIDRDSVLETLKKLRMQQNQSVHQNSFMYL